MTHGALPPAVQVVFPTGGTVLLTGSAVNTFGTPVPLVTSSHGVEPHAAPAPEPAFTSIFRLLEQLSSFLILTSHSVLSPATTPCTHPFEMVTPSSHTTFAPN